MNNKTPWWNAPQMPYTEGDDRPSLGWKSWVEFIFIILLIGGALYLIANW